MLYETFEKIYALEKQGRKILKLNVGEPDWKPSSSVIEKAYNGMKKGAYLYGSSAGELSLRGKIAEIHGCKSENVVIVPGSKWGIYGLLKLHLNHGDNAVIFSPYWTAYEGMCKSVGGEAKIVSLKGDEWEIDLDQIEQAIDSRTKIIILNSPCNPTSSAWNEQIESRLLALAKQKGIVVLADDAYRDLCFDKRKDRQLEDNLLIAHTFSKTFGMTGWRIGYIIAKEEIAKKMIQLNQITITNVPIFIQQAAQTALEEKEEIAQKARNVCKKRAELACKMLGNSFTISKPNAGFYLFPKLPETITTNQFIDKLLKKGVAVTPGEAFGDYKQHVRISLCKDEKILKDALEKMVEIVNISE